MKQWGKNTAVKVFLDANVILDLYLQREGRSSAEQIILLAANGQCQAYVTTSIVHIVNYQLAKKVGKKRAEECLLDPLVNVDVIDMNHEITVNALYSKMEDSEDALQYFAGLHHKLDCFISRDKELKKSSIPVLPVYEPEEFLKNMFVTG
jgi:predicted nucleic acid-binding protein